MRVILFLSFLSLQAQIIATRDGAVHFFSTLVPKDSGLPAATRLYRYSPAGFEVEATLQPDFTNRVGGFDVSDDGQTVSYWLQHFRFSPDHGFCIVPCPDPIPFTGQLETGGK